MKAYTISEKDWKLFRAKVPGWQENYMERLNCEYIELLSGEGVPSEKFWALEKRIHQDKKKKGVMLEMRRSEMELNLVKLLGEEVIGFSDLADFSEELQDRIRFIMDCMK